MRRLTEFVPQDFANISWSFAKLAFVNAPLLNALASAALTKIGDFNSQDLANTAWAVANLRLRDNHLMDSISAQARAKLGEFEGSDFSSTAWAFSALGFKHTPLLDAISSEALKKISSLGAQQLGTLVDLNLPCQNIVELRLQEFVARFMVSVPKNIEDFRTGRYQQLVDEFEVDNFGTKGDRFLLDSFGIQEADSEFNEKGAQLVVQYQSEHSDTWWRSEGLLHNRVVSYAEMMLQGRLKLISGARYQQNGYHGTRHRDEKLVPTRLPFNQNVDRSLCSEFQLLEGVYQDLLGQDHVDGADSTTSVHGWLQLFVTGAPCLSCVGAMRQFQLLLPAVTLRVTIGDELQFSPLE